MTIPTGNPNNIMLYLLPGPKSFLALKVPQKTAEVKKVL
jgi:hypothetical protein